MSVEKKSIHVRVSDEQHAQLATLATLNDKDIAEFAARLLGKMIAAEFHEFRLVQDKYLRLGISGKSGD